MATSNTKSSRSQLKQMLFPTAFSILIIGGLAYWFTRGPSQEEAQRQSICKNWGYEDPQSLARCARSQADVDAVIAPKFHQAKMKAISSFDEALNKASQNRTVVSEADYKQAHIAEIEKAIGGPNFPSRSSEALEGQKFKLAGRIITQTPDQSDPADAPREWEPQSFQLWGPVPKGDNTMPNILSLDIESLNRDERKFIQDHCDIVSFAKCSAVVFGHVGTVKDENVLGLHYRGLIADEVMISPVDEKTAQ